MRILLCGKKKTNFSSPSQLLLHVTLALFGEYPLNVNGVFCVSCVMRLRCFRSDQSVNDVNSISTWCSWHRTAYTIYVQWIFSKMALGWHGGDKLLNKVFCFSFAHKKYSRSFVKLQLNPWCHMDYFTDLLAMFLDLDRVRIIAVYGGSESSQIPSKIS